MHEEPEPMDVKKGVVIVLAIVVALVVGVLVAKEVMDSMDSEEPTSRIEKPEGSV